MTRCNYKQCHFCLCFYHVLISAWFSQLSTIKIEKKINLMYIFTFLRLRVPFVLGRLSAIKVQLELESL